MPRGRHRVAGTRKVMVGRKSTSTVPGVRRRVYVLGILSEVVAAVQIVSHLVMLSVVLQPENFDGQVATVNVGMAAIMSLYLGLTGRLLFLFHEKRYEETKGPEWLWWFCTIGIATFNCLLVVWFSLLVDIIPAVMCGVAVILYLSFFKFAKDDLKFLRDAAANDAATIAPIMTATAYNIADLPESVS